MPLPTYPGSRRVHPLLGLALGLTMALLLATLFSGCAATGSRPPTVAEVRDNACPVILGTVAGLQVTPEVAPEIKDKLKEIEPAIIAACAVTATPEDLASLAHAVFPVIMQITAESNLTPEQKQTVIIAVTTARLMIANLPHHAAAADLPTGESAR